MALFLREVQENRYLFRHIYLKKQKLKCIQNLEYFCLNRGIEYKTKEILFNVYKTLINLQVLYYDQFCPPTFRKNLDASLKMISITWINWGSLN